MAEKAAHRRKSNLVLSNISPVIYTYDELVQQKLEPGKFPTTKTGMIKLFGMLVLLFTIAFFISRPECANTASWYPFLLPLFLGITLAVQLVLFLIFSFGLTVKRPGFWIYLDIGLIILLSIISIVCSVFTYNECTTGGVLSQIAGPSGIAGGLILFISCGAIFLMYRYVEDTTLAPTPTLPIDPRKSIFA